MQVGVASHVYRVSLGMGTLVGHNRACSQCGTLLNASLEDYAALEKKSGKKDIEALLSATYPTIRTQYAQRLEIEARIAADSAKLDPPLRAELLAEPFSLLDYLVQNRFREAHIDLTMAMIFSLCFVLGPIYVADATTGISFLKDWNAALPLMLMGIGAVGLFLQGKRAQRKFMRKHIYPIIARTLGPLNPSQSELQTLLAALQKANTNMGKRTNLPDLLRSFYQGTVLPR